VVGIATAQVSPSEVIGSSLQSNFIWVAGASPSHGNFNAVFRRVFTLPAGLSCASFHVFAYTRYQLFINGNYAGRGPNRFENSRPEYDSWDIKHLLKPGPNVIAVLVRVDSPLKDAKTASACIGRVMMHTPGFTARLDCTSGTTVVESIHLCTDSNWTAFYEPSISSQSGFHYASIPEVIDARLSPGMWEQLGYVKDEGAAATPIDTRDMKIWPKIQPRTIPLLRESIIPFTVEASEPVTIAGSKYQVKANDEITLHCPRVVLAYTVIDITAKSGTRIEAFSRENPASRNVYFCKDGPQTWMLGDVFGFQNWTIRVTAGIADIIPRKVVEVVYPFTRVGEFHSSDSLLDRIWEVTAKSLEVMSEDAYVDCIDRERSEWMDNDPPMFDATRVMMAGPIDGEGYKWADARLYKNMLIRVAMTQNEETDGMMRARTCSELIDIHTRMEDRACVWVEGLRKYYDATGDEALVKELWPNLVRLLDWFLARRTNNGLIRAREWIAWDNPLSYATCEGAALNSFVYRALSDGAYMARAINQLEDNRRFDKAALELKIAFNSLLWDEAAGAFSSAYGDATILPGDDQFKQRISLTSQQKRMEPTLHANLYALDRGIVPSNRQSRVVEWTLKHSDQIKQIMAQNFYFKLLYSLDTAQNDIAVLDRIRTGWAGMANSRLQLTWEKSGIDDGSEQHCYGIVPGYILSSYVLGVRREAPVRERKIIIEPHLGDLSNAKGVVVTEFGPVPVVWKRLEQTQINFTITVPADTSAELFLPAGPLGRVLLNGAEVVTQRHNSRLRITLGSGSYQGTSY